MEVLSNLLLKYGIRNGIGGTNQLFKTGGGGP